MQLDGVATQTHGNAISFKIRCGCCITLVERWSSASTTGTHTQHSITTTYSTNPASSSLVQAALNSACSPGPTTVAGWPPFSGWPDGGVGFSGWDGISSKFSICEHVVQRLGQRLADAAPLAEGDEDVVQHRVVRRAGAAAHGVQRLHVEQRRRTCRRCTDRQRQQVAVERLGRWRAGAAASSSWMSLFEPNWLAIWTVPGSACCWAAAGPGSCRSPRWTRRRPRR